MKCEYCGEYDGNHREGCYTGDSESFEESIMKQHTKPCDQCPFRRESAKGWLGGLSADEFKWLADSDTVMPCHKASQDEHGHGGVDYEHPDSTLPQCAGRAIYWANQCKRPRDATIGLLTLPKDTRTVFNWPHEFVEHHKKVSL